MLVVWERIPLPLSALRVKGLRRTHVTSGSTCCIVDGWKKPPREILVTGPIGRGGLGASSSSSSSSESDVDGSARATRENHSRASSSASFHSSTLSSSSTSRPFRLRSMEGPGGGPGSRGSGGIPLVPVDTVKEVGTRVDSTDGGNSIGPGFPVQHVSLLRLPEMHAPSASTQQARTSKFLPPVSFPRPIPTSSSKREVTRGKAASFDLVRLQLVVAGASVGERSGSSITAPSSAGRNRQESRTETTPTASVARGTTCQT